MSEPTTRRRLLVLAALASGGGLLAACAAPGAPATTASATGAAAAGPAAAPGATAPPAAAAGTALPAVAPATAAAPTALTAPATAPTSGPGVLAGAAPPPVAKPGVAVPNDHPTIAALYDAAKKEGKVSWWDQRDPTVAQKFVDAFQKQFPGVTVEYFEGTQDVIKARSIQEARAGKISYDFIDTAQNWPDYQASNIVDAKTDFTDLLILAGVDKAFIIDGTYSPEFTVYGSAYNSDLVKEADLPDNLDGFSDPKWKGQLGIEARLRPYVYGTPFLGGEDNVVDMLTRLKNNQPQPTDGDTKSQGLLVAGEFPVLIGAYLQRLIMMKNKPWGFVPFKEVWSNVPRQGHIVPNGAPHPNAGKLYLWWFLGPAGQALTDTERFKGNPAPDTGTGPSKWLQEHHMAVRFAPTEFDVNYDTYLRKYRQAIGLPVT